MDRGRGRTSKGAPGGGPDRSAPWTLLPILLVLGCPGPPEPIDLPPTLAELNAQRASRPLAEGDPAPRIALAFTLGERGDLLPCACPEGVTGGFARRSTFVEDLRGEIENLVVLAGPVSLAPAADEAGDAGPDRMASLLALHAAGGTDVVALGAADLAGLTPATLEQLVAGSALPLIATNLETYDGSPLAVGRIHVVEASGRRVAVVSALDPTRGGLVRSGFAVGDPEDAIRAALAELPEPPDAVVALTDAASRRLKTLAANWTEVDFVIGAAGRSGEGKLVTNKGGRAVVEDPSGLRVGLLDLIFTGETGEPFLDDERLREIGDQRLVEHTARMRGRWLALEEAGAGAVDGAEAGTHEARILALGRSLPGESLDGHCFGYRSAPLLKIVPEAPLVDAQIERHRLDF